MATCITGDKIYILSCLNIFADVTGSIGSWSSFYLYVMTFFFFSVMNTATCITEKKKFDCLSNTVQKKRKLNTYLCSVLNH